MSRDGLYRALEGVHNLYFEDLTFGQFIKCFLDYFEKETYFELDEITDRELMSLLSDFARDNQ